MLTRRALLRASAAATVAAALRPAHATDKRSTTNTRPIPKSGEALPVIGLGTWQTFDVGDAPAERAPLVEVMRQFLAGGARVVDSSPMYGRAEAVTGDIVTAAAPAAPAAAGPRPFLATKVWTRGRAEGIAQM